MVYINGDAEEEMHPLVAWMAEALTGMVTACASSTWTDASMYWPASSSGSTPTNWLAKTKLLPCKKGQSKGTMRIAIGYGFLTPTVEGKKLRDHIRQQGFDVDWFSLSGFLFVVAEVNNCFGDGA